MKKILGILSLVLITLGFTACNSATSSPEKVTAAYLSALQKNDVEKAMSYCHFSTQMTPEQHDKIVATYTEKLSLINSNYQGVAEFTIGDVEMAEDGEHAVVKYNIVYGNGETKDTDEKVVKVDNKWLIDTGK